MKRIERKGFIKHGDDDEDEMKTISRNEKYRRSVGKSSGKKRSGDGNGKDNNE